MGTGCIHLPLLGLLDVCLSSSCLPPQKVEVEKTVLRKLDKTVLIFSNSRNLLCMSMANWISVSTWGAPRPYRFGEISLFFGLHFEATQYCSCSHPVALPQKAALFVSHALFAGIFPHGLGHFFYFETSVEHSLLPSLFRKLFETMPACLLLHP